MSAQHSHAVLGSPIARGSLVALLAALLFGVTTPLVKHFGAGAGAFATAALLYAGAMAAAGPPRARGAEAPVRRAHAMRLTVVAVFGAALAPACLAWGLQNADATAGSLMLNLEAVFTVFLAWALYQEPIGKRVVAAVVLMLAGGAVLAVRAHAGGSGSFAGLAVIAVATLAWAIDSALTRPLADLDPRAVVFWKAAIGAGLSLAVSLAWGESWPSFASSLALLACGATGYGLSLRAYLRAQRVVGAARTASLFALAPFIGALVAIALGERHGLAGTAAAAVLFGVATALHVSERHAHTHRHAALSHEHAHRHDDAHHDHVHETPVTGEHSHFHDHAAGEHDHPHGPDLHHRHGHDDD